MPPSKCVSVICLNTCRGDVARQVVGCAMRARQCSSGAAQRRPRASSSMPCLTQSRFGASRGSSKWRTHYLKQWRQLIKRFWLIITKVGPSHLEFLRCPNYWFWLIKGFGGTGGSCGLEGTEIFASASEISVQNLWTYAQLHQCPSCCRGSLVPYIVHISPHHKWHARIYIINHGEFLCAFQEHAGLVWQSWRAQENGQWAPQGRCARGRGVFDFDNDLFTKQEKQQRGQKRQRQRRLRHLTKQTLWK